MTIRPRWVVAASLLFATSVSAQGLEALLDQLLAEPQWSLGSEVNEYSADNLESLAAGHRQEILDYGFRRASSFDLAGPSGELTVTLYEMIDSAAAYGLFAMERDYTDPDFESGVLGAESYRTGEEFVFWQSNYVGKLSGPQAEAAEAAAFLTSRLPGLSRKAPVSMHLPSEDLIPESERYIVTRSALEAAADLDPDGLGFENSVEVAMADYRNGSGVVRFALLMYPTPQLASVQTESWLESFDNAPPNRRVGPLLGIVTDSSSPGLAESVLSRLTYQTQTTWNAPPEDPLTVPELILAVFKWIGVALLFTLVVGVGFGGFRIYMKTHYPGRYFPSDEEVHLVQLNINQHVTAKQLRSEN